MWHIPPGKNCFDKSKLWKVARRIIKLNKPGAARLSCNLRLARKDLDTTTAAAKHPWEEDMVKRVLGVMVGCIEQGPTFCVQQLLFQDVHAGIGFKASSTPPP
jgi:hypothetical protein